MGEQPRDGREAQSSSLSLPRSFTREFSQLSLSSFIWLPAIPCRRVSSFVTASLPFAFCFPMYSFSLSEQPSKDVTSHRLAGFLPPLILRISMVKTSTSPPPIFGGDPRSPYPSSDGMYISHLSPSTINCIASVQPPITWLGAKVVGEPRLYPESKSFHSLLRAAVSSAVSGALGVRLG